MYELNQASFTQAAPLFAAIDHNRAIVYAVLEGNSPGRIFVDHPRQPTCAFLAAAGAYSYVAGDAHNAAFCQALPGLIFDQLLPQTGDKELVLFPFTPAWQEALERLLHARGAITIHRKVYHFDPQQFAPHREWRAHLPAGFHMQAVDAAFVASYPAYRDVLQPASQRFGVCLLEGESLASICTAVFVGGGEAEIDIYTPEIYRRRGLAGLAASAFIEACLARRLTPSWACWPERKASRALAKKLGFTDRPDVPAILWAENL